jgi:hypothetical protein
MRADRDGLATDEPVVDEVVALLEAKKHEIKTIENVLRTEIEGEQQDGGEHAPDPRHIIFLA